MLQVRPVAESDLPALIELVKLSRGALTSLSPDPKQLERRIDRSVAAFADEHPRPAGELYSFVLEDSARLGVMLGTASIVSKTGGFYPFYAYQLESELYKSDILHVEQNVQSLHLVEDHNGPTELGGLFLRPGVRGGGFGRMLGCARYLFMAARPQAFDPRVIAEVRGVTDEDGNSPFWDAVGRHFFNVDFPVADQLSYREKSIIADLMPDHPLYVSMLPKSARDVIGVEHDFARPARRMLESEGFAWQGTVDIFDAGPTIRCDLPDIRGVRESMQSTVAAIEGELPEQSDAMICNDRLAYRAMPIAVDHRDDGVHLPAKAAAMLELDVGDPVRFVKLRPTSANDATHRESLPFSQES